MKFLILSKNQIKKRNWGRELFKLDIKKFHDVEFWGYGYENSKIFSVPMILKQVDKPDIIFTSVYAYASMFTEFELVNKIPKIHLEVDYTIPEKSYCGTIHVQNPFYYKSNFDLIFGVTKRMVSDMKNNKISKKIFWLPFSVSIEKYKNLNLEKEIDIMATFNTISYLYPNRIALQSFIKNLPYSNFTEMVTHYEYIKKINQSKIFITSNNVYNSLNMKYTEILACGTLLFANRPEDLDDIGLKNEEHLIIYNDFKDLKIKIDYYLKHDKEREEIAKNGMKLVREKHNNDVRIKEMTEIIKSEFKI